MTPSRDDAQGPRGVRELALPRSVPTASAGIAVRASGGMNPGLPRKAGTCKRWPCVPWLGQDGKGC